MRHISCAILIAAVCGCSNETEITQPLGVLAQLAREPRYEVVKLSASLGGTVSVGIGINNLGWVAGFSNEAGDATRHAALWRDGVILDLGTLGGPNSNVQWPGLNNGGMIVGISETATIDPLGEEWSCSAFFPTVTGHTCVGFVWENGVMTPLPTLGGNNGFATGVNNRGQVVGWAETSVHDPTCNAPQVLQFLAVMWEPKKGTMQELPPLPGNSTSAATAINGRGQAVGISGDCDVAVGRFSARHAVLWEAGAVTDIGNLGGVSWHTPMAINERGDIVGFSNPPGDNDGSFIAHAFLWTREQGIQDLSLFPGDDFSQAFSINTRGQVVGRSCGPSGCRAVLWQDGVRLDLNQLVGPNFADKLLSARDINEAGQITGNVLETSTGKTLVFVATPIADRP
jgi:probable HAF family extracellular repeat protein